MQIHQLFLSILTLAKFQFKDIDQCFDHGSEKLRLLEISASFGDELCRTIDGGEMSVI